MADGTKRRWQPRVRTGRRTPPPAGRARGAGPLRGDRTAVGIDLGGTKIAVGVVSAEGEVLEASRMPTRAERAPRQILDDIVGRVRSLPPASLAPGSPVGVGVAGQVDAEGTVLFGPNLNWHDVPLGAGLARALRRPVSVLNDVQAATYGEWRYGAGQGAQDVVCLFVGTGVGGGIVADGRLYHGATGTAGELGHLTIERNGRRCRCPNSGCLEAYAGGWAIAERAQESVKRDPARGARLVTLAGSRTAISAETVEQAYRARDPLAQEIVEDTMGYLVCGLVSIVNGINPRTIVLGGGVLEGFSSLVPVLGRQVRARALPAATEGLRIVPARLGAESGVIGAAAFARDHRSG